MDRLFGLDGARCPDKDLSLLATFFDPTSLALAEGLLEEAGIPYLKKDRGSGGAVQIIMGYQMFGTDVFVRSADLEAADEALLPLSDRETTGESPEDEGENAPDEDEEK